MLKQFLLFITFLLIGIVSVIGYKFFTKHPNQPIKNIIETVTKPQYSIANPPPQSQRGQILAMSGQIFYEDRVATQDSEIKEKVDLKQGETIRTGDGGNLSITFPGTTDIKLYPATQLEFVQTLPVNFVTKIASGSAEFKKTGNNPLSIRAAHLLINQNSGILSIGINEDPKKGIFTNLNIIEGQITIAYNDTSLISHVQSFDAPQRITFSDILRKFE